VVDYTWHDKYNESGIAERAVVSDRKIMNGTPCFRGTRVPFQNLIDYLEGGHSVLLHECRRLT